MRAGAAISTVHRAGNRPRPMEDDACRTKGWPENAASGGGRGARASGHRPAAPVRESLGSRHAVGLPETAHHVAGDSTPASKAAASVKGRRRRRWRRTAPSPQNRSSIGGTVFAWAAPPFVWRGAIRPEPPAIVHSYASSRPAPRVGGDGDAVAGRGGDRTLVTGLLPTSTGTEAQARKPRTAPPEGIRADRDMTRAYYTFEDTGALASNSRCQSLTSRLASPGVQAGSGPPDLWPVMAIMTSLPVMVPPGG